VGGLSPWVGATTATVLCIVVHVVTFLVKVVVMIWFQMLIRWSLPRFRYDQVMDLCWKIILPLSVANVFVTAGVMIWLGEV
jgi:NADH-quinone oxidoreductase subunit H